MKRLPPDVYPWAGGYCEAGLPTTIPEIRRLAYCHKRARWMVRGVLLCGGCKKKYDRA